MGAMLIGLEQDGPASRAGMLSGDVVVQLDGKTVAGVDDLIRLLDRDRINRAVEVEVLRLGRIRMFSVTPVERKTKA